MVAVALIRPSDGKVIVEERKQGKLYAGLLGLVGGEVEPDESRPEAAVREVREETGLVVEPDTLVHICSTTSHWYEISSYIAEWTGQLPAGEPLVGLEGQRLYWKSFAELLEEPASLTPATLDVAETLAPYSDSLTRGQIEWFIDGKPADQVELRAAPSKNDPLGTAFPSASFLDALPLAHSDTSQADMDTPPDASPQLPQMVECRDAGSFGLHQFDACNWCGLPLLTGSETRKARCMNMGCLDLVDVPAYCDDTCSPPSAAILRVPTPASLEEVTAKHAGLLYLAWSAALQAPAVLLAQLSNGFWDVFGGMVDKGENALQTAFREFCEEFLGLSDGPCNSSSRPPTASEHAARLTERALVSRCVFGPFGSATPHSAFLLTGVMGDIDNLPLMFTANLEVQAVRVVRLADIDGSSRQITTSGEFPETLLLRNKVGYARVQAAKAIAANMVGATISAPLSITPVPEEHDSAPPEWPSSNAIGRARTHDAAGSGLAACKHARSASDLWKADEQATLLAEDTVEFEEWLHELAAPAAPTAKASKRVHWPDEPTSAVRPYVPPDKAIDVCSPIEGDPEFETGSRIESSNNSLRRFADKVATASKSPLNTLPNEIDAYFGWKETEGIGSMQSQYAQMNRSDQVGMARLVPSPDVVRETSGAEPPAPTVCPPCIQPGGVHTLARCDSCLKVIQTEPCYGTCVAPGCSTSVFTLGPFCTCEEEFACGVWKPLTTSTQAREAAEKVKMVDSLTATTPPHRYLDSPWLAVGAGQALAADLRRSLLGVDDKVPDDDDVPDLVPQSAPPPSARPPKGTAKELAEPGQVITWPPPPDFQWPHITHWALYEHTGSLREAWRELGYVSASVADRPPSTPPSPGTLAFVAQVYDVIMACPYPILVQTSHVECGPASWSSWATWPQKVADGRMLQAAEELLWVISIGDRAGGEQPHTAHEHTVGPPTQVTNANKHGGNDKTWCLWLRNLDQLLPTNVVPVEQRHSVLSNVHGSREQRMLQRSPTEPEMARAICASIDQCTREVLDGGRPAGEPCPQYHVWRRALHHNFGIFASRYAPKLLNSQLIDVSRAVPCLIIVPTAPTPDGPAFLVPLRGGDIFGVLLEAGQKAKEAAEAASQFISIGIETQHMHSMGNATKDMIIAVPWDVSPCTLARTRADLEAARASLVPSMWALADALDGTPLHEPALMTAMRMAAMRGPVMRDDLNVGIWRKAKPAVARQRARQFQRADRDADAAQHWQAFMADERKRAEVMKADIMLADGGSGLIAHACADVRVAADYEAELPVPPQRLPTYTDAALLKIEVPMRPPPVHTDWLHTLPPQHVPEGFEAIQWTGALRRWMRRMTCEFRNEHTAFDAYCYEHGHAPTHLRRPADQVFGKGAAKMIPHKDGIGSWNFFDILTETRSDGWLIPLDFTKPHRRKWIFEVIARYIGSTSHQEMLSFLFHGVRWKLDAPRQVRLLHNLARLDTRAVKVHAALQKLADAEYVQIVPICPADEPLTVDGPNPFLRLPQWDCPIGGVDRADGLARIVGDMSAPHGGIRERNEPEGEPQGPEAVSFNDLSGPKGHPKEGYDGPMPFPWPEVKPRPRHKYAALALLRHYAHLNGTFVVTMDDDMRHMFFQFSVIDYELQLAVWHMVVRLACGRLWLAAILVRTMNQGGRNASKIACDFAEEWLDAWRRQMDKIVAEWLPQQRPQFIAAYNARLHSLGLEQARPFWAGVYTDNFDTSFAASDLAAMGLLVWKRMNKEANIWLQESVGYGTCTDWIGGRYVTMGGFGCVSPSKRTRAINSCTLALAGDLSRELYEKNNAFMVHVLDICDWPQDSLKGITAPLKVPGRSDDPVVLTPLARDKYQSALELLRERNIGSFYAGVDDAFLTWSGTGEATMPIRVHASDTCTDPLPTADNLTPAPYIAGMVDGRFWRFKLEGSWLQRHITLTESAGPSIGILQTVSCFPDDINVMATDATSSAAAGVGTANAADLLEMRRTLQDEPTYHDVIDTCWFTHWKGWGNGITDALSRDNLPMALRIAKAFGIKLVEMPLTPSTHRFMHRLLWRTRVISPTAFQIAVKGVDGTTHMVMVTGDSPISDVITVYAVEAMIDGTDLRVVYQGKPLPVESTIDACGIKARDTVHVLPRMRAGMLRDLSEPPSPLRPAEQGESSRSSTKAERATRDLDHPMRVANVGATQSEATACRLSSLPPSPRVEAVRASPRQSTAISSALKALPELDVTAPREQGSPQPQTAKAARAQASQQIARRLASVDSPYAISAGDPLRLMDMVADVCSVRDDGLKLNTKKADEWGFKWAVTFGLATDTRWMRPRVNDPRLDVETECWYESLKLFWVQQHMQPSARRAAAGYDQALPTSSLLASYGHRRVMRDCGRYTADMRTAMQVLKGMCETYKHVFGPEAFEKHQAAILSRAMSIAIAQACASASVPEWTDLQHSCWAAIHTYELSTGTRKDEVTKSHPLDDVLRRFDLVWIDDDGAHLIMTVEVIASRRHGHLLEGTSVCSKCDRLNVEWSKQKQYFRLVDDDPLNFAKNWREWELAHPCPVEARKQWPAFSVDGKEEAYTPSQMAREHRQLCTHAVGPGAAAELTFHSYRASVVSALAAARDQGEAHLTEPVQQMMLRWKTLAALMSYSKTNREQYANNVQLATGTDPGPVRHAEAANIEPASTLDAITHDMHVLSKRSHDESAAAAEGSNKSKAPTPPRPKAPPRQRPSTGTPTEPTGDGARPHTVVVEGSATPAIAHDADSWGIVGTHVDLPNEIWDEGEGKTRCTITHFLHKHAFPDGGTHIAYAVSIDNFEGLYAVRADTIARHLPQSIRRTLSKKPPPRPLAAAPHAPAKSPPPSPPPSPSGGDTFGTRRQRPTNWGKSDKASRERARLKGWGKKRRAFEREAWAASHPQECPVCMDREKTHLLYRCGMTEAPWHRNHGLCEECATTILDTTARCPLCALQIVGIQPVGTAFFVNA